MGIGDASRLWAFQSIKTLPMQGPKGPASFVSALVSAFDNQAWANYVSWRMRFPEGPYFTAILDRLEATRFPASGDANRLYYIGGTFQLRQYPYEADSNYELRLGTAWDLHGEGGTHIGMRKAFEAYGFPEVYILEECYYPLMADESEYSWAMLAVVGPNYGDLPIEGCYLGQAILDGPNAHLGTGTFSKTQIDELVRRVVLENRQIHDCPLAIAFRFGTVPILDLCNLDQVELNDARNDAEYALIKGAHILNVCHLDETTLDGFGV